MTSYYEKGIFDMTKNTATDIDGKPYHRSLLVMVLLIGTFCTMLNQTILATAFPKLMQEFKVTPSTIQWLTTGFMLVMGIMIPISAWIFNRFKTKRIYLLAMVLFLVGTIVCYLSTNFPMLLIGRLIQSVAVGILVPMVQTIMLTIFPPEKRGTAMGLSGMVIGLAPAIGPTLSGYIIDHFVWRDLFGMIIPIVIVVLVLASIFMKNVLPNSKPKLSIPSVILSTLGFGLLLYGFSSVGDHGWTSKIVLISLFVGFVFVIIFSIYQLKMSNPFLDLKVFKQWRFTLGILLSSIVYMMMIGVEMVLPMYIQNIRGQSAFNSGLLLLPGAILIGIMMPITGRVFDKYGAKRLAVTGLFISTLATVPLVFLTTETPLLLMTISYAIRLFGISMVMMPLTTYGMNALPNELISHGSAVNNTVRQIMGSVGTAVLFSVLSNTTSKQMPSQSLMSNNILEFKTQEINALLRGYESAFFVSAIFGLIALIMTIFLKDNKNKRGN